MNHPGIGFITLALSGMSTASFALPLKKAREWSWENTWLVYASVGLVIIPLTMAMCLVPHLGRVYATVSVSGLIPPLIFGFCWGIAQVTFGLAIRRVGIAMAFAIVVGISAVVGSALPLIFLHPSEIWSRPSLFLLISVILLITGLRLYAQAGRRREEELQLATGRNADFGKGLWLCIFTGCTGSMLNLGFAFGNHVSDTAVQMGASPQRATFAIWALVLGMGYIPSLAYTAWLLRKNKTSRLFSRSIPRESLLATISAALWAFGMLGYGVGAAMMGKYGTSIGYAVAQTILLLWSSALGIMAGEWRQVRLSTRQRMFSSLGVIVVSVVLLGLGTLLG